MLQKGYQMKSNRTYDPNKQSNTEKVLLSLSGIFFSALLIGLFFSIFATMSGIKSKNLNEAYASMTPCLEDPNCQALCMPYEVFYYSVNPKGPSTIVLSYAYFYEELTKDNHTYKEGSHIVNLNGHDYSFDNCYVTGSQPLPSVATDITENGRSPIKGGTNPFHGHVKELTIARERYFDIKKLYTKESSEIVCRYTRENHDLYYGNGYVNLSKNVDFFVNGYEHFLYDRDQNLYFNVMNCFEDSTRDYSSLTLVSNVLGPVSTIKHSILSNETPHE